AQTPARMGGPMIQAVKIFFRDWAGLLYWIFFKPTALRAHLEQMVPEQAAHRAARGGLSRPVERGLGTGGP
ncbi:MAG TPA: hypothetical protein VJ302_34470, partial [Blastocatellia bacterium]|nr:hypothetical protein [Blastocatellia bacterium]